MPDDYDARVRSSSMHAADSDCFRLEDCLYTPDKALEYLRDYYRLSSADAAEYLCRLPVITVE